MNTFTLPAWDLLAGIHTLVLDNGLLMDVSGVHLAGKDARFLIITGTLAIRGESFPHEHIALATANVNVRIITDGSN